MYGQLTSGLVVSGNSYITLAKIITSGDALTSLRVSGFTDFIGLRLERNEIRPLTGGVFTEVADYVSAEIYIHVSGAQVLSGLRQRINDFKITVASGAWESGNTVNIALPTLVAEDWTMPHERVGRAKLTYRFRYLL